MAMTWKGWAGVVAVLAALTMGAAPAAQAQQTNICVTSAGQCQMGEWGWPGQDCWCPSSQGPAQGRTVATLGGMGGMGRPGNQYSATCGTAQGSCPQREARPVGSECWCPSNYGPSVPGRIVPQAGATQPSYTPPQQPSFGAPRELNELQDNALKDGCAIVFANDPRAMRACLSQQGPNWRSALERGCQHRYNKAPEKLMRCMEF